MFRRKPPAPVEDLRTEKVAERLEAVTARMERLMTALEAQLTAEEEAANGD